MEIGRVLKEILAHDRVMANIVANGEWRVQYAKSSFIVLLDDKNARTLFMWKERLKDKKSTIITWRYMLRDRVYTKAEIEDIYRHIRKKDIVYTPNKINVKKYNKRINDEQRLKINQRKQLEITQKLQELQEEYDKIKYKRKQEYKEKKAKLKQLIKGYEQLLQQLKQAEKELKKKLKEKQNAKVLKI